MVTTLVRTRVLNEEDKENRMKNKINIRSLVLGAALGGAVMFSMGAALEPKRLEYRQVPFRQSDVNLNKMADEGWTVVCTGGNGNGMFYIMTRTKQ
jgi:hypothetical protein